MFFLSPEYGRRPGAPIAHDTYSTALIANRKASVKIYDRGYANFCIHSNSIHILLFKDVRAQNFPRTDFFKTLTAGRQ